MHAQCIGQDGLDDISMRDDRIDSLLAQQAVPLANGVDRPGLHRGDRLPAREGGGARVALNDFPEGLLGQVLQGPSRPIAITALAHALIDMQRDTCGLSGHDRIGGLACALERTRHDSSESYGLQSDGSGTHLLATRVVQGDTGRPARKDPLNIGRCAPVANENDGGHACRVAMRCHNAGVASDRGAGGESRGHDHVPGRLQGRHLHP